MGVRSGSPRRTPPAIHRWCRFALGALSAALVLVLAACTPGTSACTDFVEALRDRDGALVWKRTSAPDNGTLTSAECIEVA